MLVTHIAHIVVLVMVVLLAMMLLVGLSLVFMAHSQILISLMSSAVNHILAGKMVLTVHVVRMVRRSLRYWRVRRRWSVICICAPITIYW